MRPEFAAGSTTYECNCLRSYLHLTWGGLDTLRVSLELVSSYQKVGPEGFGVMRGAIPPREGRGKRGRPRKGVSLSHVRGGEEKTTLRVSF